MTDIFSTTVRRVRGQERAALQDEERLRAVPGGRRRLDQEEPRRLPQEQGELRFQGWVDADLIGLQLPIQVAYLFTMVATKQRNAVLYLTDVLLMWLL